MPTLTGSRLFRFLLSLVTRLRWSLGRVALTLQARLALLWRSILAFARRSGQSQVRLLANNVPVADDTPRERPRLSEVEEEAGGTLAALPVRRPARWQDELPIYQALTSGCRFSHDPIPAIPEVASQRYRPRRAISQIDGLSYIPAGQQKLLDALSQLPNGWRQHVHPEGSVFFYHEGLRVFTESDVTHHETEILYCVTTLIQKAIEIRDVILDELTEIVLNLDDDQLWRYYFVDHRNRLLFWLQPIRPREDLNTDVQGISEYSHIKYLVEAQYWYAPGGPRGMSHCEYYPHNRVLPRGIFQEVRGMLNYTKTDMMTADSSTSPFAQDELVAISDLVNSLKDDEKICDPYSIWVVARLMVFFTENQFLNFCGQPCARLNADTPLFGQQTWNRSIAFKVINVFLFGSLNDHAVRLQRVWVDGIIIQPRWKDFINRLRSELGQFTIFSTVMLAVNFSFLAVPGVMPTSPTDPASPTVITIYCSVVSTIGSIIFSFAMMHVYSDPGLLGADTAAEVMRSLSQTKLGMACLAITHSLPIACLVWSIVLFSTALAIQIFRPKVLPTVVTLGVECGILVSFGIMSMFVMRLFSRYEEVFDEGKIAPTVQSRRDVEKGLEN